MDASLATPADADIVPFASNQAKTKNTKPRPQTASCSRPRKPACPPPRNPTCQPPAPFPPPSHPSSPYHHIPSLVPSYLSPTTLILRRQCYYASIRPTARTRRAGKKRKSRPRGKAVLGERERRGTFKTAKREREGETTPTKEDAKPKAAQNKKASDKVSKAKNQPTTLAAERSDKKGEEEVSRHSGGEAGGVLLSRWLPSCAGRRRRRRPLTHFSCASSYDSQPSQHIALSRLD